jgi:hypothetical protein
MFYWRLQNQAALLGICCIQIKWLTAAECAVDQWHHLQ